MKRKLRKRELRDMIIFIPLPVSVVCPINQTEFVTVVPVLVPWLLNGY
jgi:hypothetical protein